MFPGLGRIFWNRKYSAARTFLRWHLLRCAARANVVICLNRSDQQTLRTVRDDIVLFPSEGLDIRSVQFYQRENIKNVGFVGRPIRDKGILTFLDLARANVSSGLRFHIFGGKTDSKEVQRAIEQACTSNEVCHHGYTDKQSIYSQIDLLILPSKYGEGFPLVVLEAMASGCQVIVYESHWTEGLKDSAANVTTPDNILLCFDAVVASRPSELRNATIQNFNFVVDHHKIGIIRKQWRKLLEVAK